MLLHHAAVFLGHAANTVEECDRWFRLHPITFCCVMLLSHMHTTWLFHTAFSAVHILILTRLSRSELKASNANILERNISKEIHSILSLYCSMAATQPKGLKLVVQSGTDFFQASPGNKVKLKLRTAIIDINYR